MNEAASEREPVVIANASGFWGDEAAALARQIRGGPIDYLTLDYLAEITMIILARQRARSEEAGYARDFVTYLEPLLGEIAAGGVTVVCNAGGIHPEACGRALERAVEAAGVELPVAVVAGDDLMPELGRLSAGGVAFEHLDSGEPLGDRLDRVRVANAYIGARPIVEALRTGARIVVTGRTYDAASVVAPIVHELDIAWDDYDRLASALLAGHTIECGAQVTGGNYTRWREVSSFDEIGFPLVRVEADASFTLTKHPGTGGLVSRRTVTEQILYEIGDPRAYVCPDVVADFTSFRLDDDGPDRVRISGVRGAPPPPTLKVSMALDAGKKTTGMVVVSGPDAVAKSEAFAEIFWSRVGDGFEETRTDLIGYDGCWGRSAATPVEPNEIALRFAARSFDDAALARFGRELAGIALAGPPGICGAGGRPKPSPAYAFWPGLIDREHVHARVLAAGSTIDVPCALGDSAPIRVPAEAAAPASTGTDARVRVPLGRVAHARSGDKGNTCNIGVAALDDRFYPELVRELSAARVAEFFSSRVRGEVTRYRLDNLSALNFVLRDALGGGGTVSLDVDAQGKTLSQGLLLIEIDVAADLLA